MSDHNDHPDDIESALTIARQHGMIQSWEVPSMRALISRDGLFSFETLIKQREHGVAQTDEERVYTKFNLSKEWVDGRLK